MARKKAEPVESVEAVKEVKVADTNDCCKKECSCDKGVKENEKDWFAIALAGAFGLLLGVILGLGGNTNSGYNHHSYHFNHMNGYMFDNMDGYNSKDYANNYPTYGYGQSDQLSQYDQYGLHGIEQGLRDGYLTVEGGQVVPMFLTDDMTRMDAQMGSTLVGPNDGGVGSGAAVGSMGGILHSKTYEPTYEGLQSFDGSTATTK